jgi:hypothetical protein
MTQLPELVARLAARVRERYAARGGVADAPAGDLNTFLSREIRQTVRTLDDPYGGVIRGWDGAAYQLDLCWWEEEDQPERIVLGLAGAILDFEVRQSLGLPT